MAYWSALGRRAALTCPPLHHAQHSAVACIFWSGLCLGTVQRGNVPRFRLHSLGAMLHGRIVLPEQSIQACVGQAHDSQPAFSLSGSACTPAPMPPESGSPPNMTALLCFSSLQRQLHLYTLWDTLPAGARMLGVRAQARLHVCLTLEVGWLCLLFSRLPNPPSHAAGSAASRHPAAGSATQPHLHVRLSLGGYVSPTHLHTLLEALPAGAQQLGVHVRLHGAQEVGGLMAEQLQGPQSLLHPGRRRPCLSAPAPAPWLLAAGRGV